MGVPVQLWLPFYTPCTDFVAANFANLVSFSHRCQTAGGSAPVAPPPPPAAGGSVYYAQGTLSMNNANVGNTAKRQNRFKQNLRADMADALDLDQESILITALSPSSVTIDIFGEQSEVQAATAALTAQLADPSSVLLSGSTANALTPNQRPNMQVTAMDSGSSGGGGPGTLKIRIDDVSDGVYFNGDLLGVSEQSEWEVVHEFPITAGCNGQNVMGKIVTLSPFVCCPSRQPEKHHYCSYPLRRRVRRGRHHRLVGALRKDHQDGPGLQVHADGRLGRGLDQRQLRRLGLARRRRRRHQRRGPVGRGARD